MSEKTAAPRSTLRVAITGSHGMVGTALIESLRADGHQIVRVVRSPPDPGSADVFWRPTDGDIDKAGLEGMDAVVHLAGEWLGERWTAAKKRRIRNSRVEGTALLSNALASLDSPPPVLVSASAVGYYGSRGDERLVERSGPGSDFLAEVVTEWEAATEAAVGAGIRVVNLRSGVILSARGGALGKMLLPFRVGVGGKVGDGDQWMSWIALADEVSAIRFLIDSTDLSGPINVTSPNPVTNEEFTRTLGRVLNRPTPFRIPATALKVIYGEMAEATLLTSQRAGSDRLQAAGFTFRFPDLEPALRAATNASSS